MTIKKTTWSIYLILAAFGLLVWWRFSYPQLAFTELNVDRFKAMDIARTYLKTEIGIEPDAYHQAIVFHSDEETNRFLQRALGFDGMVRFMEQEDFELFYWVTRFFKEGETDSYQVFVSSATGEVLAYRHILEDTHAIPVIEHERAKQKAVDFLGGRFGFDPDDYQVRGDLRNNYDNRTDYAFSWQKKSVVIPWDDAPDAGYGRLVTMTKISGEQVLSFSKSGFQVPDKFKLAIESLRNTGHNFSTIVRIINFLLLFASVYIIVMRRNHLAMHLTKNFYIWLAVILFVLSVLNILNQFQVILFEYKSSVPLTDYIVRVIVDGSFSGLVISMMVLMPSLAGELLRFEQFPDKKENSFLHYLRTTFFSRALAERILMGYLVCVILLGIQALLTEIGQRYWGVWQEFPWMTHLTTAYFPLLAGFILAYKASLSEEILFRMFAIGLGKRMFKRTWMAVVLASLVWGFGHSGYPVFPQWFRGVEVTALGLFLSSVYLRFGIVTVIVAHFLFDAFWGAAPYLLGGTTATYFMTALTLLLLPLVFALLAWTLNRRREEKPLHWQFNKHQEYNLNILKHYLRANWDHYGRMDRSQIEQEVASHYWDLVVIQTALDEVTKEKGG